MKHKIGFDIHGVIDTNPEFFGAIMKAMVDAGIEVYVITGPGTAACICELEDMGIRRNIHYTNILSIVEHNILMGVKVKWDDKGPHMPGKFWNRTKADLCKREGIELHIDDSSVYGRFFKTPYARFYAKK